MTGHALTGGRVDMQNEPSEGPEGQPIDYRAISRLNRPYAFTGIKPERLRVVTAECDRATREREARPRG